MNKNKYGQFELAFSNWVWPYPSLIIKGIINEEQPKWKIDLIRHQALLHKDMMLFVVFPLIYKYNELPFLPPNKEKKISFSWLRVVWMHIYYHLISIFSISIIRNSSLVTLKYYNHLHHHSFYIIQYFSFICETPTLTCQ